ncbi:sulfotransferase family protein [Anthocerotibacter panamensis]|uniref:sulfotransferase family protein n=1 Tax=Anthocerotibacter panamensis TaxID=2857077 RepID=UPI001C4035B8|nr:sulfotransferase [Anthocerotibacter panamensis]
MPKLEPISVTQQPLTLGSLTTWLRGLRQYGPIDSKYLPRALYVTLSSLVSSPLRLLEEMYFHLPLSTAQSAQPPVFILGHWRSGTTHLHQLMSLDPHLAYVSYLHACAPGLFLSNAGLVRMFLNQVLPATRPMDNVSLSPDSPFEEEFGLANLTDLSFCYGWYFPRIMQQSFRHTVLLDTATPQERDTWKRAYLHFLRKVSLATGGKRLVLKNPPNTARVKMLLELFPEAKFVHIYRNPYRVYFSMLGFYRKFLPLVTFQDIGLEQLEANIFWCYEQLMQRYLDEKAYIPASNLLEVCYEDLETAPLKTLEMIYQYLNLESFAQSKPIFAEYIAAQSNYQKNQYPSYDQVLLERIYKHWYLTIDLWGYKPPSSNIV